MRGGSGGRPGGGWTYRHCAPGDSNYAQKAESRFQISARSHLLSAFRFEGSAFGLQRLFFRGQIVGAVEVASGLRRRFRRGGSPEWASGARKISALTII